MKPLDIPTYKLPMRLARSAEFARTAHFVQVEAGVLPEHVMHPDFWVNLARRFRVNDLIEVVAEDGTLDMDLRVIAIDPRGLWVQVKALRYCGEPGIAVPGVEADEIAPSAESDPDGYRIEFAGPHKFRIVRGNDVIEAHIPTKAEALRRLAAIKAEKVAA